MTKRINVEASGIPVYCAFYDLVDTTMLILNPRNQTNIRKLS
jgi:hypothetical protein